MLWTQGSRTERGPIEMGAGLTLTQTPDGRPLLESAGGVGTQFLNIRVQLIGTTANNVTVRVSVSDTNPGGNISVGYTGFGVGSGGVTPTSPQTIAGGSVTNSLNSTGFVDFVIDRPAFGAGVGRVVFTAFELNRLDVIDSVDVPERGRDIIPLTCKAVVIAQNTLNMTVRVSVADAIPGVNISLAYVRSSNVSPVSPSSPQTILAASITTDLNTTGFVDFNIPRPSLASGTGQVVFSASGSGRIAASVAVDVVETTVSTVNLQTLVTVVSATPTTITVVVTATDPLGVVSTIIGLPVSQNLSGIITGSNPYTIPRNPVGGGTARVTWTATASGRIQDSDSVDVPDQGQNLSILQLRASLLTTTATTCTIRVAVADSTPAVNVTITPAAIGVGSGGVTPNTPQTLLAGVITNSLATTGFADFTVARPAFGVGTGRVTFTGTASSRVSDSDSVDIPEIGQDTIPLACRASLIASNASQITVRVAVADPFPGANITLTYTVLGTGTVTPSSPQTLSGASVTNNINTTVFVDFVIVKPDFGLGAGRVVFTATEANRVSDSDSVDVPEKGRDTIQLVIKTERISISDTQLVQRVYVASPVADATIRLDYALSTNIPTSPTPTSPASPQTFLARRSIGSIVGLPFTNGALAFHAVQLNLDANGAPAGLAGVIMDGDQFVIAGESGSPLHAVVGGPFSISGNAVNNLPFSPEIASGGVADNAAITFAVSFVDFTIPRPLTSDGSIVFIASATDRVAATVTVLVPAEPAIPTASITFNSATANTSIDRISLSYTVNSAPSGFSVDLEYFDNGANLNSWTFHSTNVNGIDIDFSMGSYGGGHGYDLIPSGGVTVQFTFRAKVMLNGVVLAVAQNVTNFHVTALP